MSFMDAHQSHFGFPQSHASGGGGTIEATGWSYQAIRSVANPQRGIPETGRSWFDPWLGQTKQTICLAHWVAARQLLTAQT